MKKIVTFIILIILPLLCLGQERFNMNKGWSFKYVPKTDKQYEPILKEYFYKNNQSSCMEWVNDSIMQLDYDDSDWRKINTPHDYMIEGVPEPDAVEVKGFYHNGIGIYRKRFDLDEQDKGKAIWINFEGVFRNAQVFVNGFKMYSHPSGYTPFKVNISDIAHYGHRENIIAVFTSPEERGEGWWYEGAGIYRPVYLEKSGGTLHFSAHGVAINPVLNEKYSSADVNIHYTIQNRLRKARTFELISSIVNQQGEIILSSTTSVEIGPWGEKEYQDLLHFPSPKLWNLDEPNLYYLISDIREDREQIDRTRTRFGIRKIVFDPEKGMFLNGKHIKIKGANMHQDHGGIGVAIPKEIYREKIKKLKEFGFNGYRSAHNCAAPDLLDVADEEGILIINEQRVSETNPRYLDEFRDIILSSRNHPSVFLYNLANEEYRINSNDFEEGIATTFMQEIVKLDPQQRPATMGRVFAYVYDQSTNERIDIQDLDERIKNSMLGAGNILDLAGFNYNDDVMYGYKGPLPIIQTEASGNMSTRGIYETNRNKNWVSSYPSWKVHDRLRDFLTTDRISGSFMWTGYDYGGEATPFRFWPGISSHFGLFDICGFPKDMAYFYKAVQLKEPVLHLFPHWNWEGMEGDEIKVVTYTNLDEVELFQDGKSLGKQQVLPFENQSWEVKYRAGKLMAKGYKNGKLILTDKVVTAGPPHAIRIIESKNSLRADGKDAMSLRFEIIDKDENICPRADNIIHITIKGEGHLLGVANGSPTDTNPRKIPQVRAFNGLASAIIQSTEIPGKLTIEVTSNGLKNNKIIIRTTESPKELTVQPEIEGNEGYLFFRQ
jgi:beta-galactosidase